MCPSKGVENTLVVTQGCSVLLDSDIIQDVIQFHTIPEQLHTRVFDAVGSENVESKAAQLGEEMRICSDPRLVFTHRHISDIMIAILDAPVISDRSTERSSTQHDRGNVERSLIALFPTFFLRSENSSFSFDLNYRFHQMPFVLVTDGHSREDRHFPTLDPIAGFGRRLSIEIRGHYCFCRCSTVIEQCLLVFFDLHYDIIVGFFGYFQRLCLTVDSIEGEYAIGQAEFGYQLLRRWDFIGLFSNLFVRQDDAAAGQKRAENLSRFLVSEVVEAPAQYLTIEGHEPLSRRTRVQGCTVLPETDLELISRCPLDNVSNRRVGRHSLPIQLKGFVENAVVSLDIDLYLSVGRCVAQNREYRKEQDMPQSIAPSLLAAMILDFEQEAL